MSQPPKQPTKNEVYRWFSVTGLIASATVLVVVLIGQFGLNRLIAPLEPLSAALKAASSQIARAQKIGILADDLANAKRPGKLYTYRTEIAEELNEFVAFHRGLVFGDSSLGLAPPASDEANDILLNSTDGLDRFARDFEDKVRENFLSDSLSVEASLADDLKQEIRLILSPRLNDLSNQLASDIRANVRRTYPAQIAIMSITILSLLIVSTLCYWPLSRKIARIIAVDGKGGGQNSLRFDEVTGLANRTHLIAFMGELCKFSRQHKFKSAVLNLEIGGMELVRETLKGPDLDVMVTMIARRIESVCRSGDFIARLGDDEFVVVLTSLEDDSSLNDITNALRTKLSLPLVLEKQSFNLKSKIGIKIAEPKDQVPASILNQAASALKVAKASDNYDIQFYSGNLASRPNEREREFQLVEKALKNGEFTAYFQPILDIQTDTTIGVEALVRWRNPKQGVLTPIHFMETVENRGLSNDLTRAVLSESFRALKSWQSSAIEVQYISVNLSADQLKDSAFVGEIKWIADSYDLDPALIALEVSTKAIIENNSSELTKNLKLLTDYGFKIFFQDFGLPGSNVPIIKDISLDTVKIERAFVSNIDSEKSQHDTMAGLIGNARKVGAKIIASGVETPGERSVLQQLGVDAFQGYLTCEPSDAPELTKWLEKDKTRLMVAAATA